jgi:predicted permease
MQAILQDIRFALRQLRKSPIFTLVAVLTLAIGIGANTAVFSLLDQAILRSLPVSHPEQLVRLHYTGESPGHTSTYGGEDTDFFSYPMYRDLRDKNPVFEGLIANDEVGVAVQWKGRTDMNDGELVTGNYFQVLGVQPAIGRVMVPSDDVAGSPPVVVLSYNFWKTTFGSDPGVLNQTVLINAHPYTIVGVTRPGFHSVVAGATPSLFLPATAKNQITPRWQDLEERQSYWLTVVGRLKPGISRGKAEASLAPLWHALRVEEFKSITHQARWQKAFLDESRLQVLGNARGFSPLRDQVGTPLWIVMGMVGLLVLMACVNVSSLLLVRAAGRVREMSVRYAMGAKRLQIVRQLLVEGLLLGVAGGGLGLLLAPAITSVLVRAVFTDPTAEKPFSTHPDLRILAFNFAIAFLVSVLFSLAPALRFLHPDLANSLKQQTVTASGAPLRFRRVSVGVQIGLSLLLLIAAGLFVRTLRNLRAVDVGFATDHLVSFGVNPRLAGYEPEQVQALNRRILQTLAALPGARAVAATDDPDLANNDETGNVSVQGYNARDEENMQMEEPWVTPKYFATMQVPLLAGRGFNDGDTAGKANVAMVNATFARQFFGSPQGAIGHAVAIGSGSGVKYDTVIVGVVGDTKHTGLRAAIRRTVFRPLFQSPQPNHTTYMVRTWQPPDAAETSIRGAMQQLDSKLALGTLRTMDEMIADNLSSERLIALLAVTFGALAVMLAAIGLYGVLAYATAQRTREIGIRMALGAQRSGVMQLVMKDVLWLTGISIAATIPLALLLARSLGTQLYGVRAGDPVALGTAILLVSMVAMIAAVIPARRAAGVNPTQALRSE